MQSPEKWHAAQVSKKERRVADGCEAAAHVADDEDEEEEVEDDFTSRNIWWSVAATLIILAVGLGVTYKFQWLDSEKNIVARNDVHQEEKNSILEKSEPPLNESKSQSAADTFLMPEIFADNEDANITTADAPIDGLPQALSRGF